MTSNYEDRKKSEGYDDLHDVTGRFMAEFAGPQTPVHKVFNSGETMPYMFLHRYIDGPLRKDVPATNKLGKLPPEVLVESIEEDNPVVVVDERKEAGVSLYVPHNDEAAAFLHKYFKNKSEKQGNDGACYVSLPGTVVPDGVLVVYDSPVKLSKGSTKEPGDKLIDWGLHFSMYPAKPGLRYQEYNDAFRSIFQTPCLLNAAAEPTDVKGNAPWPSDRKMALLCRALWFFSESTADANLGFLAFAIHHHIGATDMSYSSFLNDVTMSWLQVSALAFEHQPDPLDPFVQSDCNMVKEDLSIKLGYIPNYFGDSSSDEASTNSLT